MAATTTGQSLLVSLSEELDCDPASTKAQLILASQSPRRREILDMMGLSEGKEYVVEPSPLDESKLQVELAAEKLSPVEYTRRLAEAKALALAEAQCGQITNAEKPRYYLGSDTIVEIDDSILEKPKSEEDAKRMLNSMSGRKHRVHTGVALYRLGSSDSGDAEKPVLLDSFTDTARVTFTDLTEEDIDAYVRSGEPMDKAGSYGIQGRWHVFLSLAASNLSRFFFFFVSPTSFLLTNLFQYYSSGIGGQFVTEISGDFFTVMGLPMHKTSKLIAKALQAE